MRLIVLLSFVICHFYSFSQKVTLTPLSFNKDFRLEKINATDVLKDYTQFAVSPFAKIPKGFTLSDASVFYKFDTLNCSLFIKKREDVDSLIYYRDCEDGRYCVEEFDYLYWSDDITNRTNELKINYPKWFRKKEGCCNKLMKSDTSALFYNNEFVDFNYFLSLDKNLPSGIISENYVANKEYHEFVNYCIDSVIRHYIGQEDTNYLKNYKSYRPSLNYEKPNNSPYQKYPRILSQFYYPDHEKYYWKKERDARKIAFEFYNFPRYMVFSLEDCKICYDSKINNQCGNEAKACNHQLLNYSYSQLSDFTQLGIYDNSIKTHPEDILSQSVRKRKSNLIYPDTLMWLLASPGNVTTNYHIWASQNYFNKTEFENLPVQGVNYWQANAYLKWKTKFHNRQLIRDKSPYRVLYTFPLPEETTQIDVSKLKLPEIDFEKFVITNEEYENFVSYVVDSTLIQMIIHNSSSKNEDQIRKEMTVITYDDNGDQRYDDDWFIKKSELKNYFSNSRGKLKKHKYYELFKDFMVRENEIDYWNYNGFDTRRIWFRYQWKYYHKDTLYQHADLYLNGTGDEYSHVYAHRDRSEFLIRDHINIFPGYNVKEISLADSWNYAKKAQDFYKYCDSLGIKRFLPDSLDLNSPNNYGLQHWERDSLYLYKLKLYDFKSNPSSPITAITYEQAKAYYHWKNEVPYIPTKEEWNLIKQGINPYEEKELEVPGPFFRYVIRVYPVREND